MLRTRLISSVIALVILGAIVFTGPIPLGVFVFLLSVVGIYEFYNSLSKAGYKTINIIGYISCLPVFMIALSKKFESLGNYLDLFKSINYISLGIYAVIFILFLVVIFAHDRYNLNDISLTVFGILYVPFLFSFVTLVRNFDRGFFLLWMIVIGAFATDTSAYFAGKFFGKHKLLPAISPKKTVEGSIGGVIGCIVIMTAYGVFLNMNHYLGKGVILPHFALLGLLCGVISQVGDWAASAIKRYVNIKDYGNIMPGHGGVLDRCDSILFVAPVIYFYFRFILML